MLHAKITREEIEDSGKVFSAIRLAMNNAEIMLISEEEDKLGTLAVSVPQRNGLIGQPLSSILLGNRNTTLSRMLAERFAEKTRKIALVSIFVGTPEKEAAPIILKLVNKIMKKMEEKN